MATNRTVTIGTGDWAAKNPASGRRTRQPITRYRQRRRRVRAGRRARPGQRNGIGAGSRHGRTQPADAATTRTAALKSSTGCAQAIRGIAGNTAQAFRRAEWTVSAGTGRTELDGQQRRVSDAQRPRNEQHKAQRLRTYGESSANSTLLA
ncbi:hypothetical protein EXIGLDRAFT_784144 [Exidia glandulosa HHB12029]|uniref:Uncharacterized protein n=1 Tax=Exidia glandulosa HHB12029 TaxID=1314781 RepID=A0A166MNJ4_EXIGL|nr:hypothetical protein EXIGLDRAFT_784144 [Exidia glandulosa HHB12029]